MPDAPSSLRARLAAPTPAIGHFIFEFATPGIGYLARNAGADFLVFDLEHSGFTFESAKLAVLAGRAAGIPVVVRVPSHDAKDLARACDIGADGVMAPLVHNAAQARAIVDAVKYPPQGRRGVGMVQMHDRYRLGPLADKARAENDGNAVFLQIESSEGVADVEAIAATAGVDCLWVGHMDLSCSLGTPGRFDTPAFTQAIERIVAATKHAGIRCARLAPTAEECAALAAIGFDCFALGTDTQLYQSALARGIAELRTKLGNAT